MIVLPLSVALVAFALTLAPILSWPAALQAQDYPTRPVRIIVPFGAGGPADVYSRVLAQHLSDALKQPFVVEDRPGAGSIIGTDAVAKSPPDGYTLLVAAGGSFLINPAIGQKLPYDPLNDFAPISMTLAWSLVLVANKSFPADTVAQVIEEAKRTTTSLNFATPGPRDIGYLAGELLALRAGIRMQHINYNGSASALTDVIGGRVPLMFDAWQSSKPYVDGGQLKLIATTGVNRLRDAPQAPTIAETYPGFSANPFSFVLGPAGIPEPILQKLSADLRAVVDSPEFAAKMLPLGTDPKSSSPQELRLLI